MNYCSVPNPLLSAAAAAAAGSTLHRRSMGNVGDNALQQPDRICRTRKTQDWKTRDCSDSEYGKQVPDRLLQRRVLGLGSALQLLVQPPAQGGVGW